MLNRESVLLTDRVAVVTGAAAGIGAATAIALAGFGADVAVCDRDEVNLAATTAAITATGRRAVAGVLDVRDGDAVRDFVAAVVADLGGIDVLVNNAGGTRMGPLESIPTRGWDSIFDLNTRSTYILTREAGRHMIAQGTGSIVNISSGAGVNGVKGGAHYSAAKAAVQMFTRVTAAEWGRFGVRCNCVAAGAIASERVSEAWKVAGLDEETMGRAIPLRRTGTPDDMANMIVFFASEASSYITGETISVSGGPNIGGIALP